MQSVFCLGKIFIDISDENYRAGEKIRRKQISNVSICRDLGCPVFANEEASSQKAMWIAFNKVCVRYVLDQRPWEESRLKRMFSSPVRWTASSSTKDRSNQRFFESFPLGKYERKYLHLKEKDDYVYFLKHSSFMIMWLLSFVVVVHSLSRVWLLWPHELQHTGLLCPSLSPRVCSISRPLSQLSLETLKGLLQKCKRNKHQLCAQHITGHLCLGLEII